jgi:SAM-dependent methyltransferase
MSPTEALALLSPAPALRHPNPKTAPIKSPQRTSSGLLRHAPPRSYPSLRLGIHWADLGCGSGLFTLALATLLQPGSTIYAVDRQPKIRSQITPNQITIERIETDFVKHPLPLRDLDGILMANSLHYVKDKPTLIRTLRAANLRPQPAFLIIEYDTDRPTPVWVPYPISFTSLANLFHAAGYSTITCLADHPSIYNRNKIYSAYIE